MRKRSILAAGVVLAGFAIVAAPTGRVAAVDPTCFGLTPTISGAGTINGTNGDDVILGSAGADTINGKSGNDYICGGDGADLIHGNAGHDRISGDQGNDTIYGDSGNDHIVNQDDIAEPIGDDGDDTMYGGSGDDWIYDYDGANWSDGGLGVDDVQGTGTSRGGGGNDYNVYARETADGAGDAYANGDSGHDRVVDVWGGLAEGGSGNDGYIESFDEGVELRGNSGNDYLTAFADNITLNGGSGTDTCNANGNTGITFISCEVQIL